MSIELLKVSAKYLGFLTELGCDVVVTQDFEAVPGLAEQAGRSYQLPTFSVDRVDHTRGSCFWVLLYQDGRLIASVAAMLQALGCEPVGDFLRRTARHQFPNKSGEAISAVSQSISEKMSGDIVYIGELAVLEGERGNRSRLACFMRLVQVLSLMKWDCDWTYAFIPHRHLNANLDKLYGFVQRVPSAQTWVEPVPDKRSNMEWWVGASKSDLFAFFEAELSLDDIL